MIWGPESREGPQAANKPEFAERCVPDFQGDAGMKFLTGNLGRDKVRLRADGLLRERNTVNVSLGVFAQMCVAPLRSVATLE